jgi:hypothetical protein
VCLDRNLVEAYKGAMDYPTVRVRLDGPEVTAEVDITPKPEPENLVTVNQEERAPAEARTDRLPSWLLDPG